MTKLISALSSILQIAHKAKDKVIKEKLPIRDLNQETEDPTRVGLSLHVHFLRSTRNRRNLSHVRRVNPFHDLTPDSSRMVMMPKLFLHHLRTRQRLSLEILLKYIMLSQSSLSLRKVVLQLTIPIK